MTQVDLNPPTFQVLTTEIIPFTVEWQDLVGIGNTVSVPFGILYDNTNGIAATGGFVGNFGANGTQAQYILDGSKLQLGHTYTGIVSVVSNGQTFKNRIIVSVPR